mgnify:CR=1 FL=1
MADDDGCTAAAVPVDGVVSEGGGTAAVEAKVGKGHVFLFGPEITFRAQPHGTFKFLFNGILASNAERSSMR